MLNSLISETVILCFSSIKVKMKNNSCANLVLALKKQNQMATLIAAKDFSPIEDAETIKRACKGYLSAILLSITTYLFTLHDI